MSPAIILAVCICLLLSALALQDAKQKRLKRERQLHGLEILQSGLDLMIAVQQHRGMSVAWRNGDSSFSAKLVTKKDEIARMFSTIRPLVSNTAELAPDQLRLQEIEKKWAQLSRQIEALSPDQCFTEHTALVRIVIHLIGDMGEHLGLLDGDGSELAKLSNILLMRVPLLLESIGQARALGSGYAAQGQVGAVGRIRLDFLASRILECRQALSLLDASSLNTTGVATIKIESLMQTLQQQFIQSEQVSISSESFFRTATEAIDACLTLWREVAKQTGKTVTESR